MHAGFGAPERHLATASEGSEETVAEMLERKWSEAIQWLREWAQKHSHLDADGAVADVADSIEEKQKDSKLRKTRDY